MLYVIRPTSKRRCQEWICAVCTAHIILPDGGRMRIVEVTRGLGQGGLEVALNRRLKYAPPEVSTAVVSTAPSLNVLSPEIRRNADDLIEVAVGRWGASTLIEQITRLSPDVVISHVPRETIKILASSLPIAVPVVVVAHHPESSERVWARPPISAALRAVNSRAALHVAVSGSAAAGAQCRGAVRVEVLPLGAELDDAPADPSPWPDRCRIRLLALGRLRAFKNLDGLIRGVALAAPALRKCQASLAIVGSGPEEASLASIIRHAGVQDLVTMRPSVANPSGVLRAADVTFVTSLSEGGPITAMEAILAGSRLAMTRTGLFNELENAHHQVTTISGFDERSIAEALVAASALGPISATERDANAKTGRLWEARLTSQRFYDVVTTVATSTRRSRR